MALRTALRNYWKLGEASGTRVDSISAYNMTDATAGNRTGINGNAVDINGTNTIETATSFGIFKECSISLWALFDSQIASAGIIQQWRVAGSGSGYQFWRLGVTNHATLVYPRWTVEYNTNVDSSLDATASISLGNWHHIVVTWSDYTHLQEMYVNNTKYSAQLATTAFWDTGGSPGDAISVGGGEMADSQGTKMNGGVDEIGVWKRVLTPLEVTALYNGGVGNFYDNLATNQFDFEIPTAIIMRS